MSIPPVFSFYIPGEDGCIGPDSFLWQMPLSGKSSGFLKKGQGEKSVRGPVLTVGDYFTAAETFLQKADGRMLFEAFSAMAGKGCGPIRAVDLFLEKHGAFYHPLRVKVVSETGRSVSFVLNGAVSEPGLALIEKEYQLLAGFEKRLSGVCTPRVFGAGVQTLETRKPENLNLKKRTLGFFLGEWFEEFREFHVSEAQGKRQIAVWESNGDVAHLSLERAQVIYEQVAYILTAHYNVHTGEQIFPWHHAAGDFVVNPLVKGLPVKLITVRGYQSLMEFDPATDPKENVLPALLFFFLNLTLRMRLDRLDGVGTPVFLEEPVLTATVHGFLRSLGDMSGQTSQASGSIKGLENIFAAFLAGFSQEQLLGILVNLIQAWPPNALEFSLAQAHLASHSSALHSLFKNV
ncbi:MAG: hypothetical protein KKF12_12895 [Proteobacteria bacterium]|nr:hypothetical protein [Desulfobacula sp.]MBU3950533.1 hypothetical protein [Pseudomonadota bacterium]MBU4131711.1 hypothetical protein [Pseudomonadota bacterium]